MSVHLSLCSNSLSLKEEEERVCALQIRNLICEEEFTVKDPSESYLLSIGKIFALCLSEDVRNTPPFLSLKGIFSLVDIATKNNFDFYRHENIKKVARVKNYALLGENLKYFLFRKAKVHDELANDPLLNIYRRIPRFQTQIQTGSDMLRSTEKLKELICSEKLFSKDTFSKSTRLHEALIDFDKKWQHYLISLAPLPAEEAKSIHVRKIQLVKTAMQEERFSCYMEESFKQMEVFSRKLFEQNGLNHPTHELLVQMEEIERGKISFVRQKLAFLYPEKKMATVVTITEGDAIQEILSEMAKVLLQIHSQGVFLKDLEENMDGLLFFLLATSFYNSLIKMPLKIPAKRSRELFGIYAGEYQNLKNCLGEVCINEKAFTRLKERLETLSPVCPVSLQILPAATEEMQKLGDKLFDLLLKAADNFLRNETDRVQKLEDSIRTILLSLKEMEEKKFEIPF